jgi:hypothetical protein
LSYEFDVFVSYAHADGTTFARDVTRRLQSAGFTVWLDEEQLPAGDPVKTALVRGLQRSRHAVLVVTGAWLRGDWTGWEADVFVEEGRARRLVPVIRAPPVRKSELGPYLSKVNWLEWPDPSDADAKFWLLRCGLFGEAPGKPEEWAARGREAQGGGGAARLAPPASPRAEMLTTLAADIELPAVFGCDRAPQWGELVTYAATTRSEALFVRGPRRYGHQAFLRRVQQCLGRPPERHMVSVTWRRAPLPVGRLEFLEALARAFGCQTEEALVDAMRAKLLDTNLLLVHEPVAESAFHRDDLVLYYTRWLPELVGKVDPEARADDRIFGVKALQSVAWWPDGGEGRQPGSTEAAARAMLQRITAEQDKARLPVRMLTPLDEITRDHVERWSEEHLPASMDAREFVDWVMDGARDPAEILDRIVQRFGQDS